MSKPLDPLEQVCRDFIDAQRIYSADTIYQSDRVIENAYDFIESICNLVGYYTETSDDE